MKTKQQQIFHYLLRSYGRVVKKASKVWQKGVKMVSKVWRFAHPTYTSVIYKKLKSLNLRLVISILVGIAGLVLAIKLLAPPITTYINTPRDLKLKNAADSTNYLYTAGSENLDIFVGEKKSYRPTVTLKNKEDSLISFTLSQTNDELSEPIRDGNVVTFENVRQGVDLKYQTLPNGIKEEIILTEKGQGNSFAFDTEINNANPKMMTNEFFGYIFYDQDDNYLFHFEKPFAVDGAGNRTDDVLLSVRRQAKEGNLY
ncbi:MAG: hypothetical protein HN365_01325, partial [Candidatus Pacebacteria bacterium]|nr:hypothetical protein [Candidatus Paceibacterota bacterium]